MLAIKWHCIFLFAVCLHFQVLATENSISSAQVQSDCSTESACERSLRILAKQQIPSYNLDLVTAPVITKHEKWLQPLLLRLASDGNKDVRRIAIAFLGHFTELNAAYWLQFKKLLLRYPEDISTVARKIKHPEMMPTLFGLVLDNNLDVSMLSPQWPESQAQLEVLLQQKIQQHAENQKDFECFSEKEPRDSLCIKFSQIFSQLPYSNQLKLWRPWMKQLSLDRYNDEFSKLILVLPNQQFLKQLSEAIATQYETQLLNLKKTKPNLIFQAQHQLVELGRESAVTELVSQLKAQIAIKDRRNHPSDLLFIRLAELAPLVNESAIVSQVKIAMDDPNFADWLILLGLTKQTGTEELIRQAWQKTDAPIDNAAALIAAAHYPNALLAKLNDEARTHWYPPIRALAMYLLEAKSMSARDMSVEQQDTRREQFSFIRNLRMQRCIEVEYPPANPQVSKWYNVHHLESLIGRFSELATTGYTTESVATMLLSVQTGTEFMPLLAQWGIDRNLQDSRSVNSSQSDSSAFGYEPNAALQLDDGWLTAADNGEWGGELRFVDKSRNYKIARGNFSDVFLLENKLLAIEGRSMTNNGRGHIYRLQLSPAGQWQARLWKTLPAYADTVWQLADGQLLFNSRAGSFLLDAKGKLKMAECLKKED